MVKGKKKNRVRRSAPRGKGEGGEGKVLFRRIPLEEKTRDFGASKKRFRISQGGKRKRGGGEKGHMQRANLTKLEKKKGEHYNTLRKEKKGTLSNCAGRGRKPRGGLETASVMCRHRTTEDADEGKGKPRFRCAGLREGGSGGTVPRREKEVREKRTASSPSAREKRKGAQPPFLRVGKKGVAGGKFLKPTAIGLF